MADLPSVFNGTEILGFVGSIVECYRDTKIHSAIQETEREKIRQQARVLIAQYEQETQKAVNEIQMATFQNIEVIRTIGKIMTKENIDKEVIEFCKILLKEMIIVK